MLDPIGVDNPAVRDEHDHDHAAHQEVRGLRAALGPDGTYIMDELLQEWGLQFMRKAADYNDDQNENHRVLGTRGQFADIWRKIGKLKKALWYEQPLIGEQPREILMDLIAHCFLTIAMLDTDNSQRTELDQAPDHGVTVAGEPWQGRTKAREPLVPACGRVACITHDRVPRSQVNLLIKHD